MKRNAKVIQISGFRGIIMAIFICVCLCAGFIGFPALVAMYGWNYVADFFVLPHINVFQGLLLWSLVAGAIYIANDKKKFVSAFKAPMGLNDDELKKVLEKAKIQAEARMLNSMVLKSGDLKKVEKDVTKSSTEKTEIEQHSDSSQTEEKRNL